MLNGVFSCSNSRKDKKDKGRKGTGFPTVSCSLLFSTFVEISCNINKYVKELDC